MYIDICLLMTEGSYKREERQRVHKKMCKVLQKGCNNPGHEYRLDISI